MNITSKVKARAGIAMVLMGMLVGGLTSSTAAFASHTSSNPPLATQGTFYGHHVDGGFSCPANEVMVGIHRNKESVTCARLGNRYRIGNRIFDPARGNQVGYGPTMHGCPQNYVIQALYPHGQDENLRCVSIVDSAGQERTFTRFYRDGPGARNDGTQSTTEYGLTPQMHVCRRDFAMQGIHQGLNDLYCAG